MNLSSAFINLHSKPFSMVLFYVLFFMTLIGTAFTKAELINGVYFSDAIFLVLGLTCLYTLINIEKKMFIFFMISGLYFINSLVGDETNFIIRQFAIICYMALSYIITMRYFLNNNENKLLAIIIIIAAASFYLQLCYVIFLTITSALEKYNYISPLSILGFLTYMSYSIYFHKTWLKKSIIFLIGVMLAVKTGHSSAVLAAIFIPLSVLYFSADRPIKIIMVCFGVFSLSILIITKQEDFDANTLWRYLYWAHGLKEVFISNYGIFGEGFGVPYADGNLIQTMFNTFGHYNDFDKENEAYIKPFHNSFITLMYHLGFAASLMIIVPLLKLFFLEKHYYQNKYFVFLLSSLVALTVWVTTNVILELPHSSYFYWLIYFSVLYVHSFIKKGERYI